MPTYLAAIQRAPASQRSAPLIIPPRHVSLHFTLTPAMPKAVPSPAPQVHACSTAPELTQSDQANLIITTLDIFSDTVASLKKSLEGLLANPSGPGSHAQEPKTMQTGVDRCPSRFCRSTVHSEQQCKGAEEYTFSRKCKCNVFQVRRLTC